MNPIPIRVLLLLLSCTYLVTAANFTECLENFKKNFSSITDGGVNFRGQPVIPTEAVGLTYQTCIRECGTDSEAFDLRELVQMFSTWLLPWLALLSQLPLGSSSLGGDLFSVIMSLGSPALAAYSLVLTPLHARSVYHRVKASRSRYKKSVMEALIPIQQIPLELTKNNRFLEFIQENHQWREEIGERLSKRTTWPLAAKISIAWVVIAFFLTLVDSFISLDRPVNNAAEGHAVGTIWLWLLCLVVGWMWIPIFNGGEITTALNSVNQQVANQADTKFENTARVARTFFNRARERLANKPAQVVGNQGNTGDAGQEPNQDANLSVDPNGGEGADRVDSITAAPIAPQDRTDLREDRFLILKDLGSLNRDERRLSAMFNYSRTIRYLVLVDDILSALDEVARREHEKRSSTGDTVAPLAREKVVFPSGFLIPMCGAAIMALILQCGTAAAAAIIIVFTPTVGLGCRSLGYIIYGVTAIIIMFLSIISPILARISETREERSTVVKGFTKSVAIAFCWTSYSLAFINAVGLILLSCLQFANFLNNCYCKASVLGRGADSYIVVFYNSSGTTMRNSRLAAITLSAVSMSIYMIFLRRVIRLPDDLSDDC